jgi:hypothetical protein
VVKFTNEPFRHGDTSFERRNNGRADYGLLLLNPGGRGDKLSKKKGKVRTVHNKKEAFKGMKLHQLLP